MHDRRPPPVADDALTKGQKQARFDRALKWQLLGVGMFLVGWLVLMFCAGPVGSGTKSILAMAGGVMCLASFPILVVGAWRMPYSRFRVRFGPFETVVTNRRYDGPSS